MFRPLFDAFVDAVRERPLIPADGGGHVRAGEALISRSGALRSLLAPGELGAALDRPASTRWVDDRVRSEPDRPLYGFLTRDCSIPVFGAEDLVDELSEPFLDAASDDWFVRLYAFLGGERRLLAAAARGEGAIAARAIIRLEDGRRVRPYDPEQKQPNAYLPPDGDTRFPIVRRAIAGSADTDSFFAGLRFVPPDPVAEVIDAVLPRYRARKGDLPDDEVWSDAALIFGAMQKAPPARRNDLIRHLRPLAFLRARIGGAVTLSEPGCLYWPTEGISAYLAGNPELGVVDARYEPWRDALDALGVADEIQPVKRTPVGGYLELSSKPREHRRAVNGFDPRFTLEGLEHALARRDPLASREAWSTLARHSSDLAGEIEVSTNRSYAGARRERALSTAVNVARAAGAWLPTQDGRMAAPEDCSLDDLPDDFPRSEELARLLGMRTSTVDELARKVGINPDDLHQLATDDALRAEFADFMQARRRKVDDDPGVDTVDYRAGVGEVFGRNGRPVSSNGRPDPDDGLVGNPERRREVTATQIHDERAAPPPAPRFDASPRRVLRAKDPAVKHFLIEEYGGRCQICGHGFRRRDGQPYLVAIYLVPARRAPWLDRPGNVLGLCANCAARFQYGTVEAPTFEGDVLAVRLASEGGDGRPAVPITLCGEPMAIRYTERHLLDLQELFKAVAA